MGLFWSEDDVLVFAPNWTWGSHLKLVSRCDLSAERQDAIVNNLNSTSLTYQQPLICLPLWWAHAKCSSFRILLGVVKLCSSLLQGPVWRESELHTLGFVFPFFFLLLYLCVHLLITPLSVSSSQAQILMAVFFSSFSLPWLLLLLFGSPHLCSGSLPRLPCSGFFLPSLPPSSSFLLSHLVTRPLERSVEFPLSQRRGQSEPHKDPQ